MLAQAYEAKGDLPASVRAYERAVRVDSTDATLLNNLGRLYRKTQQPELAIATFRKAIAINDQLVLPYRNLGISLIAVGDFDGALSALQKSERISPDDPQTLGAIGALLAERGDTAASADAFARALHLAPLAKNSSGLLGHYPAVARRIAASGKRTNGIAAP
jgi:tetratricopeptide (TPR) repeat protein